MCGIDISNYPFDSQHCTVRIATWVYPSRKVSLTPINSTDSRTSEEISSPLWEVTKNSWKNNSRTDPEDSVMLQFDIHLTRRSLYYYVYMVMPLTLIYGILLSALWLPAESGEKISLGITVFLAFSIFQIIIMDNTPVNSLQTPLIGT